MQLTTRQVAELLDVKPETVYSYVSRGMLRSIRAKDGKSSVFDADEVRALAARGGARGRRPAAERGPEVRSALTVVRDGVLYYRGLEATKLASEETFEGVAGWLWTGELDSTANFQAPPETLDLARETTAALPATTRLADRLRIITAVASTADPFRYNTERDSVIATSKSLLGAMVDALPLEGGRIVKRGKTLAARLWPRLTTRPATEEGIAALNAALVLMADHGLATSTLAARVAASSRAHTYAVVAAGLSAFDGPLHGAAATHAYRLIQDTIVTGDATAVYAERLRTEGRVEGFFPVGHKYYPDGDIRAKELLSFVDALDVPIKVMRAVEGLEDAATRREPRRPTIEFALAALVHATGMRPDAGEAVFAIARTAGWIAHALEEYEEPGLRFRLEATYVG